MENLHEVSGKEEKEDVRDLQHLRGNRCVSSTDSSPENQAWEKGLEGRIGVVRAGMDQGCSLCGGMQIHPSELKEGLAGFSFLEPRTWADSDEETQWRKQ